MLNSAEIEGLFSIGVKTVKNPDTAKGLSDEANDVKRKRSFTVSWGNSPFQSRDEPEAVVRKNLLKRR